MPLLNVGLQNIYLGHILLLIVKKTLIIGDERNDGRMDDLLLWDFPGGSGYKILAIGV